MRRIAVLALLAVTPVLLASCLGDDDDKNEKSAAGIPASANKKGAIYFGWLQGTKEPAGVVVWAKSGPGKPGKISVYVCDGVGPPQGMAVWFGGMVDPQTLEPRPLRLSSSGKREKLEIETYNERLVKGTFTKPGGETHQYLAYPARDGAGIYQVTLDENLKYTGTSTLGDKVTARASRKGVVKGEVTTADGDTIPFKLKTLSLALPAHLKSTGLSSIYRKDAKQSLVPGDYVAVIAPSSTHWLGRVGTIRTFSTGTAVAVKDPSLVQDVIGLDKKNFNTTLGR